MLDDLDPETIEALSKGHVTWLVMLDIEFDSGALRLCNLKRNFEFQGNTFFSSNDFGGVGPITENLSLNPVSIDVVISGIGGPVLNSAVNEPTFNRPAAIYLGLLDSDQQVIGQPFPRFIGTIGGTSIKFDREPALTITIEDETADWSRPKIYANTDAEQKSRYPEDRAFEFVAQLSDQTVIWPAKEWFANPPSGSRPATTARRTSGAT